MKEAPAAETMAPTELKPCPFCGGEARRSLGPDFFRINCSNCTAVVYGGGNFGTARAKQDNINAWNARAVLS